MPQARIRRDVSAIEIDGNCVASDASEGPGVPGAAAGAVVRRECAEALQFAAISKMPSVGGGANRLRVALCHGHATRPLDASRRQNLVQLDEGGVLCTKLFVPGGAIEMLT